jgi:undecaprenyl-diphosphatase
VDAFIVFSASYLHLVLLALAVGVFMQADRPTQWNLVKLAVLVFPLCVLAAQLSGSLIASPRPFVVDQVTPLIPAATDNGFPSDHTLLVMAVAAVVFAYQRKAGSVLFVLAAWVGIARILAHVHHPIDVVGSTVIALLITFVCYRFIVRRIPFPALKTKSNPTSRQR